MKRRYHLHMPGLIYGGLTVLIGVVAMNTQFNLLFWIFGVLLSGFIISGVLSGTMMLGLRIRRLDPQHGAVGEPLLVRYAVRNRLRLLPIFNVHIDELPVRSLLRRSGESNRTAWQHFMDAARAWVMHIAPRESTHAEAVFWPKQRGRIQFDRMRMWTTFPFGIVKKSVTISQKQHTLIFPMLHELKRGVLQSLTPVGPLGMRMTQRSGMGDEYFGLREYRPGDSMRSISWKMSARLDQMIAIERTQPSPPKLRVVLNLTRPTEKLRSDRDDHNGKRLLEENAICLAASLVHAAHHDGYEIGLSVAGLKSPPIRIRRSQWHEGKIMAALAAIDLDSPRNESAHGVIPEAERAGLIVIHPDRVNPGIGRDDAVHLTAAQLEQFSVGVLGWDPSSLKYIAERNSNEQQTATDAEAAA